MDKDKRFKRHRTCGYSTKSVGVISQRTIIERHPFVEDADKEMERIAEEKDDSDDIMGGHNERVLEEEEQ